MSLRQATFSGIKWISLSQIGRQLMQWITVVVLARVLSPTDFGIVGMAMVIIGFVNLFKDLGTSAAAIQKKELSTELLSTIFWLNVCFGLLATIALFLLSPLVATLYREPQVVPVLRALSVSFFISGISILQQAYLERMLAFDRLAKIEIFATFFGSLVGISSAFLGFGVMSLVYQTLTITFATSLLMWVFSPWRPNLCFSWLEAKSVGSYSLNLTGFNVFNYFARNADNLLIGIFLGAEPLGFYSLAYRILLYPLQNISAVIGRVMFPVYARVQQDVARFKRGYLKTAAAIAFVVFPLMLGLLDVREIFVSTLFGPDWSPTATLLLFFAPVAMMQAIATTTGSIYQAKGRTDLMFKWGLVSGSFVVMAIVVGLHWGIVGVAVGYSLATFILAYPCFVIPFKLIGLDLRSLFSVVSRALSLSVAMFFAVMVLSELLPEDMAANLQLIVLVTFGAVVYMALSWVGNREQVKLLLEMIGVGNENQEVGAEKA